MLLVRTGMFALLVHLLLLLLLKVDSGNVLQLLRGGGSGRKKQRIACVSIIYIRYLCIICTTHLFAAKALRWPPTPVAGRRRQRRGRPC